VLQSQESKTTSKDLTDIQANKKLNSENSENIMVQRREKTKRTQASSLEHWPNGRLLTERQRLENVPIKEPVDGTLSLT